ncbi:ArnT family glycosyltransferase [Xanthomonas phaseoli]|uniref:ArnT family glycosyltransferase n=1 Tax=Xanthomonas phaseoli TaxID=1985254 RepID=UPI001237AC57|nr:glycosyltransferase family 39 protein [Xanthomonas phaseoli pv. dieffenbachiae]MBO9836722.1 glycosyltransferase family 39 protein [Xanthomonas phaseoli pv. dieffenbachiae]MBO9841926.1 glycosyltransferase family 39 protein [Xanthomonas phaseoli pv. dieffenbachiae]MBO9863204.1 glycosyltransferase family 39 protein [Xanthomonas phaseoli pv. dieffenbachiae]MBO9866960.1 glycosyltransferase family 39 protein [Xanthomonas phaseoli pv. dieffenbachiae]
MTQQPTPDRGLLPARILLCYSAIALLIMLVFSWSMPPIDASGFRQTQTALSIDWMLRGGPFLSYLTPVLGAPWSIPFELPLFQWLAASLSKVTGMSADNSGRVLSTLFHVGCIWMSYRITLVLRPDRVLALCIAGAFAVSPLAQLWGRSVMMESTAVFFGLVFVWAMARLYVQPRAWHGGLAVVAAVLAALIKITTFFGFAVFTVLALAWVALHEHGWRPRWLVGHWKLLGWGAVAAGSALVALLLWLQHADALKAQSLLGQQVTSASLSGFNYGTLQQRLDPAIWWGTIFKKRFAGPVGSNWVFLIILIAGLSIRQIRAAVVLLLLAYLAPMLAFTNLQVVHPYYQFAQVVFATSIVGLVLWWVVQRGQAVGKPGRGVALAVFLCLLSLGSGLVSSLKNMKEAREPTPISQIAEQIRAATPEQGVVVAFGDDWSSEMPYRSGCRAVMIADWASDQALQSLANTDTALGGLPLAAMVDCPNKVGSTPQRAQWHAEIVQRYSAGAQPQAIGDCRYWLHR